MSGLEVGEALQKMGIEPLFLIQESFLGYKYRKREKKLYESDANIPNTLIRMYYSLNTERIEFDTLKKAFVSNYINQESKLEGVASEQNHSKAEIKGLEKMYEYIHSEDIDYMFNIYTLKELHQKLFSLTEFPEYAGEFRNAIAYLKDTEAELTDWTMIRPILNELDKEVMSLLEVANEIKDSQNTEALLKYIERCVILKCQIIQVHPFFDGNGRVTRGFINKLFEYAGLPPIYIKKGEKEEYHRAMSKARDENDYNDIIGFYKYKICDSIVELDINERFKNSTIDINKKKILK